MNKPKPIPIRDFIFEGLNERKTETQSRYFPKKTTKVVFQMPRTLKKPKKVAQSQRLLKVSESFFKKELISHGGSIVPMFKTISNYLVSQRSERPSFEILSPTNTVNRVMPYSARNKDLRQRPRTSVATSRKIFASEGLNEGVVKESREKKEGVEMKDKREGLEMKDKREGLEMKDKREGLEMKDSRDKKVFEKRTEKINVYIKVPEFDYSEYIDEINISK